jgi:two-component system cell cycle sensor histidine kinase/response regulator CckA
MPQGGKLLIKTENAILGSDCRNWYRDARPGRFVCLSVEDSGVGMDSELLDHIFEPYFTTKELGKGTGLGLSTVYGIVTQHEGWITVGSQPGRGSLFMVFLPALPFSL